MKGREWKTQSIDCLWSLSRTGFGLSRGRDVWRGEGPEGRTVSVVTGGRYVWSLGPQCGPRQEREGTAVEDKIEDLEH